VGAPGDLRAGGRRQPQDHGAVARQNLFAYQPYPDDLVISFIQQAAQSGVGLFRVFDALNDERNLSIPMLACKASGIQIEAALSYTVSPVHTTEYFIQYAKKLRAMGADRIAIKDMAGILTPAWPTSW